MFTLEDTFNRQARIKVVGVGGAGGNAVNRMVEEGMEHVEFVAVNTDAQDLERNKAHCRLQVGERITRGLGAGARPDVGAKAMEEDRNVIMEKLEGADMVFITAGMGGGTGSGGAPVVASIARELDILTVGIVTRPFLFEGPQRMRNAEAAIAEMRKYVDTIIIIPNQRLLTLIERATPMVEAFRKVDDVLYHAARGISDLINVNGLINIDFADAVTVMKGMGDALMGTGTASGENMAKAASELAIHSPLLDDISVKGARGVLINITGGTDMPLHDVSEVSNYIYDSIGTETDVNIIVGAVVDPNMQGQIRVTVIATGFNKVAPQELLPGKAQEKAADRAGHAAPKKAKAPAVPGLIISEKLPLFEQAPAKAVKEEKAAEVEKTEKAQAAPAPAAQEEIPKAAIEKMITDLEQGVSVAETPATEDVAPAAPDLPAPPELPAAPALPAAARPVPDETLYETVKKEVEAEKEKKAEKEVRIQRFNSVKDLMSPEEFKSSTPSIKNVSDRLCKLQKRDQFGLRNGILSHETHDDLDVPTFLRQQMD